MVYLAGESLYDIIFKNGLVKEAKPGGSVLNTSVTLSRLGIKTSLISEVGNDPLGEYIIRFLESNNVATGNIIVHDNKTPLAIAVLDCNDNAQYTFYKSNTPMPVHSLPKFHIGDIFAFGSFYSIDPRNHEFLVDTASEAKRVGAMVFFDPNIRLSKFKGIKSAHQDISKNISLADIVRASDEDMAAICHAKTHKEAYEWVKQVGCETLIYTCNKKGVWLLTGQHELFFNVPKTNVVSTIGAGDSFNAGVVFSIITNKIKKDDLSTLSTAVWKGIIENAITIASEVCKTYDNYLPQEFANKMLKKQ